MGQEERRQASCFCQNSVLYTQGGSAAADGGGGQQGERGGKPAPWHEQMGAVLSSLKDFLPPAQNFVM